MFLLSLRIFGSIQGRQWQKKGPIQTKIDGVIFKMSRLFLKTRVFLVIGGLLIPAAMTQNIEVMWSTRVSHLRLFSSSTRRDSSMDVQGDYDPCDASGFIRINAVRSASPQAVQNSLSIKLFQSSSYFLLFFFCSTDWENTTACRVCPTQKNKRTTQTCCFTGIYQHLQQYSILDRFSKCFPGLCISV